MTEPTAPASPRQTPGLAAQLISLVALGAMGALVIWMRPRVGMLISGAIWAAFNVYWARETRRVGPVERKESARSSARHTLTRQIGFMLLFVPVPGLNATLVPVAPMTTTVIGLAVQVAGAIVYLIAKRQLGAAWSSEVSIKVGHQLVRTGIYGRVRHPLYSTMLLMAAGTAIVCNQPHAVIGLALMTIAYAIKIQTEERWLREQFGAEWEAYRRTTSALIPGVF